MKAFMTGSRQYGTPKEDSDIDLVVFVRKEDVMELAKLGEVKKGKPASSQRPDFDPNNPDHYEWDGPLACSIRFGKLNLLCVTNYVAYHCWLEGTQQCINEMPIQRERAVEIFSKLRALHGVADRRDKEILDKKDIKKEQTEDYDPFDS